MSIRDLIKEAVDGGDLVHLKPLLPGIRLDRHVYVNHAVLRFLNGVEAVPEELLKRSTDSRNMLEAFIGGGRMTVGMDPRNKSSRAMMARNEPTEKGVWNFRILDPRPHVRIFGGFAAQDVFIALDYRSKGGLRNYESQTNATLQRWSDLFGSHLPVIGDKLNDYLSGNARPA